MTNILNAIYNIVTNPVYSVNSLNASNNRINNMGEGLEQYIKDAFANTLHCLDEAQRQQAYNAVFSYLGNQNNPPDIMIKGGDAIEVKKIESEYADLALNSSYPKATLKANSTMITQACRTCEQWQEKDLIYCIGHVNKEQIKSLWMLYGNIYAAEQDTYEIIKQKISQGINEIPNVEFAETKELGRVNRVDPLGITHLRIRGMWHIQNPRKLFKYLHESNPANSFELVVMLPTEKYNAFPQENKDALVALLSDNFTITDIEIRNPNNPAQLIAAKCIKFIYS